MPDPGSAGSRVIVVDGANVVGSRPDGWWRDRAGAARRLHDRLLRSADPVVLVLEGAARAGQPEGVVRGVRTVHATASGDDAVVEQVRLSAADAGHQAERAADAGYEAGPEVVVVTADRELRARAEESGATTRPPSWLWSRI